jgi:putative addiction module component (TIGR02574 family)
MISIDEILKLSPSERILLVEKVWDSISPNDIAIPESHIAESRRRLEAIRNGKEHYQAGKKFGRITRL